MTTKDTTSKKRGEGNIQIANKDIYIKDLTEKFNLKYKDVFQEVASPTKIESNTLDKIDKYTDLINLFLKKTATHLAKKSNTNALPVIVATGGYGRAEMAPHSDVDILFCYDHTLSSHAKSFIEQLNTTCWTAGIKLSFSTRSTAECESGLTDDLTFATSLLETRYIWGDKSRYTKLQKMIRKHVADTPATAFIAAKLAERDARHIKTGDSRAMLQPNVKESKGGLRDIQTLFWLTNFLYGINTADGLVKRSILTKAEAESLRAAHRFFWTVRCQLHLLAGRADDRLTFDAQPEIALRMGYKDPAPNIRAEAFMQDYFRMATETGYLTRILCADLEAQALGAGATSGTRKLALATETGGFPLLHNRLTVDGPKHFADTPEDMVRIFHQSQTTGFDIHPDALRAVRRILKQSPEILRKNKAALHGFTEILLERKKSAQTLRRMNEAGLLLALIPDFANIFAHMQYDMYHVFTADEHTINAVDMLHRIENKELADEAPLATELAQNLPARRALFAAILFHDMAKGTGGGHAVKGAAIARRMCPKMGLSDAETETAAWLVEHHLLMTMTAFKRDLSDPKTLEDFCDTVQSPERLKLLTIMTAADIMAVGPDRWNSWKAGLLSELYHRARADLSGTGSTVDDDGLVVVAQKKLRRLIGDQTDALRYLTDHAPPDFFLAFPAETMAGFVKLLAKYAGKENPTALKITANPDEGFSEVLIFTPDRKGLFATLSGAMAAAGASIMEARIFTLSNGMAFDVFQVQNAAGHAYDNGPFLQRTIKSALAGNLDFDAEIRQRQKNVPRRQMHFKVAANVTIDNNASTRHTLVEVNGKDRPGFLYDITAALSAEGLQIAAAKVTTFGARAVDVFYVKDQFGLKVLHNAKLARIEQMLKNVLETSG